MLRSRGVAAEAYAMMIGPMPRGFDPNKFNREVRAAQRKAEAQWKRDIAKAEREINREVDRVNRENKRRVDAHNRKVAQQNKRAVDDYNRKVDAHNRKATHTTHALLLTSTGSYEPLRQARDTPRASKH